MAKKKIIKKPGLGALTPAKLGKDTTLDTAMQANGNLDKTPDVFKYLQRKDFPYSVATLTEYKAQLVKLNLAELQRHAIETANILPNITERSRLEDKLEREFLRRQGLYLNRYSPDSLPSTNISKQTEVNILKLLRGETL